MPGVPPDAANIVKRVFKGMFKRGKKSKQDAPDNSATTSTSTPPPQQDQPSAAPAQPEAPPVESKAPQLPPIGSASPLQGATESTKSVPPTHPLSTGEHSKPQKAVPQNKDADPAPGAPLGGAAAEPPTVATPSTPANDGLKEPEKLGAPRDVSPPVSTVDAADAPKSGAVSAISNEQPKTEGIIDRVSSEGSKAAEPAAVEPTTQAHPTATDTNPRTIEPVEPYPAAAKENVLPQTNGTSPTTNPTSSTPPTDTPAAPPTTEPQPAPTKPSPPASDEKMPATMEEPPPIKTVRAAPGMSATSGPLEDFPEGGDVKY